MSLIFKAPGLASGALCLVSTLSACATTPVHVVPEMAEMAEPVITDRFVDVLGVRMRFRIIEGDETTVLLESGSGLGADTWTETARMIASQTGATVISYDRAGMGESDMPPGIYDVYEEMARLHRGLIALDRAEPLVLVGHSYGGFLIHIYGNLYPDNVVGMVYVDANTPVGIEGIGGPQAVAAPSIKRNDVENPTRKQRAGLRLSRALAQTLESVRRYPPLCGVPTVVITAGRHPDAMSEDLIAGWQSGHYDLARRSGGRHLIDEKSGHMVHKDNPHIIVSSVQDVLLRSNGKTAGPGSCLKAR